MMTSLAALLAATTPPCLPVAGAERLWEPANRWVIVGEIHGTNEMPDAFTNLVCLAASSGRPVTVALEYSSDWQPVVDNYLRSDGGAGAKAELLTLPIWHEEFQDGRSSVAFLRMLDRLRQMKREGRIAGVICSDAGRDAPAERPRDEAMAQTWQAMPTANNGIVLALVGNVHAMRHEIVRPARTIVTAGSLMPTSSTVTVNLVANGGKTWDCENDGCGEHKSGVQHDNVPGIQFVADSGYPWKAIYELGLATTAASPAIPPPATPANAPPLRIKAD